MRVCLMVEGQEDVTWDQWLSLAGLAEPPPSPFGEILQVQALVEYSGPMPQAGVEQVEKLFLKAAELIRGKCVAAVPGRPAPPNPPC